MKYNSNREISNENTVIYSSLLFKAGDLYGQIGGEICEFILGNNGHSSPFRCYLLPYLRCKKYILIFNTKLIKNIDVFLIIKDRLENFEWFIFSHNSVTSKEAICYFLL